MLYKVKINGGKMFLNSEKNEHQKTIDAMRINEKIWYLKYELNKLYSERSGTAVYNTSGEVIGTWCMECGINPVELSKDRDICTSCNRSKTPQF